MEPQNKPWERLWRELLESATGRADSVPQMTEWHSLAEVEAYAAACLQSLHLGGWSFGWDRALHRLGCCRFKERRITLSHYFVEAYLEKDRFLVWHTLLHELAHALAWVHRRHAGHGAVWRAYCRKLGLVDETVTTPCDDFTPEHLKHPPRFALVHADTGEVFATYRRAPRRTPAQWRQCYIPGRKSDTLGKLRIVPIGESAIRATVSPPGPAAGPQ